MKEIMWFSCTENGIRKTAYIVLSESDKHLFIVKKEKEKGVSPFTISDLDIEKVKLYENGARATVFLREDDEEKAKKLISENIRQEHMRLMTELMNYSKVVKGLKKDQRQEDITEHLDKSSLYPVDLRTFSTFEPGLEKLDSKQEKLLYLLKWNDEYLDIQIAGGPFDDDTAAKLALKKETITRLVELNVVKDAKAAEELYAETERDPEQEGDDLHIYLNGTSILFGGGYEERYQIVEYEPS